MKPIPRLLPLIAVAIGGVLAVKTLSGVQALPDILAGPQARAEEAPAKPGRPAQSPLPTTSPAKPPAAPACVQSPTDLAKAAGLSPGELQVLQNLGTRRGQLDDRERALDTQIQLLAAAEVKVDGKMKALTALKAQVQGLLGQADQQTQAEVDRLVNVYQKMKPRDAAAIMATLDDKVRIPVASKMKDTALAAILSQMPTLEAKKLTEDLAHKFAGAQAALAQNPAGPATPQAMAPSATAAPSTQATADPAKADPSATAVDPAAPARPAAPRRLARKTTVQRKTFKTARSDTPTLAAAKALPVSPLPVVTPAAAKPASQAVSQAELSAAKTPPVLSPRPALPVIAPPAPPKPS